MIAEAALFLLVQTLTWREAAPVLDRWCNDCHRPGQVGPFDFTTYDGASAYAPEIARYLMANKMPPWRAKKSPLVFSNDRRIADESIATLLGWINGGATKGNVEPVMRKRHPQWNQGQPDLIVSQPHEHTVSGEKTVDIVSFVVSPDELGTAKSAKFVQALEFRPSNRNLLHHAVLKIANQPLAAWAMCDTGIRLPPGVGWMLPAGQPLTIELHYFKRTLRPARDLTRLGLYFSKGRPLRRAGLIEISKTDIRIPAGKNLHTESTKFRFLSRAQIHAILPVFQLLTNSIRLKPEGQRDWSLWVEPFEHHLMSSYILRSPLAVMKNSVFEFEASYDNSTQNEFNPHKTLRDVIFSENGLDETFRIWLTVSTPLELP